MVGVCKIFGYILSYFFDTFVFEKLSCTLHQATVFCYYLFVLYKTFQLFLAHYYVFFCISLISDILYLCLWISLMLGQSLLHCGEYRIHKNYSVFLVQSIFINPLGGLGFD